MYFKFACENCGKHLKVSDEHVGRKSRCPYCHTAQIVPPPPAPPESPESPEDESPGLDAYQDVNEAGQQYGGNVPVASKRLDQQYPTDAQETAAQEMSAEAVSGTDVSLLISGLIGLGFLVIFYAIAWTLRQTIHPRIAEIFTDRGWIQYASVFFFGWSMAIIFLKSRKLARQKESMLFDLLPTDIAEDITPQNLDRFTSNIHELPADPRTSFLIKRVRRGLEHFRVRRNAAEVSGMLTSQSEIDNNSVESSYTILHTFLWAIPILGFIGTVIGISAAVDNFAATMEAADDMNALQEALGGVTGGLGTAFDTTLVALVMSVIIIFPTKGMQKAEEDLLNWVDEYCNENLLKRLKGDEGGGPSTGDYRKDMHRAINAAMSEHHAELQSWTERLERIGTTLTEKAARGWGDIHKRLQDAHAHEERSFNETIETMANRQAEYLEKVDQVSGRLAQLEDQRVPEETMKAMYDAALALQRYVQGMQTGLTSLNDVLANLGQERIIVEKRGWFSRK
jgi:biopolymer transport protein ExbB/TolQ/DNA-directed RNA polymerase subunit RPC12/RpoP